MKVEDRPRVMLSAEEELGITAGLQDRVAQVYGGLVYLVRLLMLNYSSTSQEAYHEEIEKLFECFCGEMMTTP